MIGAFQSGVIGNSAFSPALLFAAGEQGIWLDPSDFSTMFQDAAGTTPVTAVEQPVGKILDKSGRGNHATQSTDGYRPTLSARVNLLTDTETLATQGVTTVATNYTLTFSGTGTITLSGTKTGVYSAGTNSLSSVTAGTLTLTVAGSVTQADLRAANNGAGLPSYQRVTTATNYDTVGFPYYLKFDGSDDYLETSNIDFTATNKITAFAGARKLRDNTVQILYCLSKTPWSTNGTIAAYPGLTSALNSYGPYVALTSKGTLYCAVRSTNEHPAPQSLILTATSVISSFISLRTNGTEDGTYPNHQGTGNYGNLPFCIGLPIFNGHIYSLIIRGDQSTQYQIDQTEAWINRKTRAY